MSSSELNDLIVSAQDTFEEVLGWYGLRPYTQLRDHCAEVVSPMDSVSTGSLATRYTHSASKDATPVIRDAGSIHSRDSSTEDADVDVDLDHPVDLTCVPPVSSSSSTEQGTMSDLLKIQWGSHKKLVGIRFLFPPLDEQMSLLEKAKIWVARHDRKYFVDWTETELESVDPILRPLSVITRDIYKLHMNRSEYCRNVKLKYCLQSDALWAQQFRENLAKSPSDGGFTGLCQAKIAAAELWRKYSEHYRSHQARHPHLRNRDVKSAVIRSHDGESRIEHETLESRSCYDALGTDSDAMSEDCERESDSKTVNNQDGQKRTSRNNSIEEEDDDNCSTAVHREDEMSENGTELHVAKDGTTGNLFKRQIESDGEQSRSKKTKNEISRLLESRNSSDFGETAGNSFRHPLASDEFPSIINLTKKDADDARRSASLKHASSSSRDACIKTETGLDAEVKPEARHPSTAGTLPYWNMSRLGPLMYQLPMAAFYPSPINCFLDSSLSSPSLHHQIYPFASASPNFTSSAAVAGVDSLASLTPPKKSKIRSGGASRNEISTEYRRSERGLSFLFPSFSDHNMSLMDKVQITITRHKNNYFLGWDEDALNKLDPLVRPKMPVTGEIYKEYCHRNAMKYDSNLQFAMESTELWAEEFRKKLSLPASEGGFTSLCEVKLEAGRLWREYSGKYRMHNIVKWQMDLNSNAVPAKPLTVGGTSVDGRGNRLPFRKVSRRQRLKDQRMAGQRGAYALQKISLPPLQNGDLSSQCNKSFSSAPVQYSYEQLAKGSECSSPVIGSFSEGASPRINVHGDLPAVKVCRVSRSLDNSPSMGGSSDGCASVTSVLGDAGCSPSAEIFPKTTPVPHCSEPADEFLFVPLPRQMSVADQLFVWLERHSNNYFLEFPKESLSSLHPYLRPQVVVTRDVFQRYIPESMVDVLGKIKWMMSSQEEWAVKFCNRVCKPKKDDGFSTFEEALTEAVVLWHINKEKVLHDLPNETRKVGADSSVNLHYPPFRHHKNRETSSKCTVKAAPMLAESCGKYGILDGDAIENESGGAAKQSPSVNRNGTELEVRSMSNRGDTLDPCPNSSSQLDPEKMVQLLWNLRHTLNILCRDSPIESWEKRLLPFLPVLRRAVGSSYTVPVSSTSCMIDLILSVLHQRIEESFSSS